MPGSGTLPIRSACMTISFALSGDPRPRLVARLVGEGPLPADLSDGLREAATASRFAGKAGQVFESFVPTESGLLRMALAGTGKAGGTERLAGLERAGGALVAKYLTSGEIALGIDFTGSALTAAEAVAVLLGARLRSWRYDIYKTKLSDEQKVSLTQVIAIAAPEGSESLWATEAALAEGVEFTRELVTEPANVIYP
eukprot:gene31037-39958_t